MIEDRPTSGRQLHRLLVGELVNLNPPEEADSIAYWVIQEITGLTRTDIIADKPVMFQDSKWNDLQAVLDRLLRDEPVQYIFGRTWFRGLEFRVDENVLIPRPETEELVELIVKSNPSDQIKVLDIGSGSGCIAIALAKEQTAWEVHSCDISEEALLVAKGNAELNGVEVRFFQSDILSDEIDDTYDIIVSNPPYVPKGESQILRPRVVEYEPKNAVFVPDEDALIFYRRIASLAKNALVSRGKLYFEVEEAHGKAVLNLLEEKGWQNVQLIKDINHKDRIVSCENSF